MELLWQQYVQTRDANVREQLIERYLPYARMLAAKLYARPPLQELEFADYLQYATIGLIEAVDRFDPGRDNKFETFSAARITGAMLNGVTSLAEKQEQLYARKRILLQRTTSLVEGTLPPDMDVLFAQIADIAIGLAVGFALEGTGMYQADETGVDNTYRGVEMRHLYQRVIAMMETLPDNERRVVKFHYQQQLGFEEISAILGVTKGRVSQIHKNALQRLRRGFDGGVDLQC